MFSNRYNPDTEHINTTEIDDPKRSFVFEGECIVIYVVVIVMMPWFILSKSIRYNI